MPLTITVIALLFFVVLSYKDRIQRIFYDKNWREYIRIPLVLITIIVVPLFIQNTFFDKKIFSSPEEKMEFAKRYKKSELYEEGYQEYAKENSRNPIIQLEYLDYSLIRNGSDKSTCKQLVDRYSESSSNTADLAKMYVGYRCGNLSLDLENIKKYHDSIHGVSYLKGLYYESQDDWEMAIHFYGQETSKTPDFSLPYREIVNILKDNDKNLLDQFMLNNTFEDQIPTYFKNDYYFENGHWGAYFKNIYANRTLSSSWLVFIAAFVVSFVWLYYMRLMDFYNREKWSHVFLVFVLGGLFTNLCLPIYDFSRLVLDFGINGEAVNDFFYSTLIIGGGEELVKFLPWFLFGYFSGKLKEPFDYILYASVSALGFAFVENFIYLENYGNITIRALVTAVAHMFDAVIIAYAFVIVRYRLPKNSPYKVLVIIAGFLLAMLAHGFYDFWLLSNSVSDYRIITMIFFVISLHIWFFFKNNAMNHSPFFRGNERFNIDLQKDVLYISMIAILMLQYVYLSYDYGTSNIDTFFFKEVVFVGIFLFYFSVQLTKFEIAKGIWYKLSLSRLLPMKIIRFVFNKMSESGYSTMNGGAYDQNHDDFYYETKSDNFKGLELRLFAPKSNKYIGNKLPVSGYCSKPITVNGDPNWYLFTLNSPIVYNDFVSDKVIIRNKEDHESLLTDKIEIYFMFIPSVALLDQSNISIQDLRYAGRAYSRPLNKERF